MKSIARVRIQRHDLEQLSKQTVASRMEYVLDLYRVIGNSPAAAILMCTRCDDANLPPPRVVITIENLRSLGQPHIAVCEAVKQTCYERNWEFHLCGVVAGNRMDLTDAGVLYGIDSRNVHDSAAALLRSLSEPFSQQQHERTSLRDMVLPAPRWPRMHVSPVNSPSP